MTKVIFYMEPIPDGQILAVFPDNLNTDNTLLCYSHIGQHSSCSTAYLVDCCRRATRDEYTNLLHELKGQGYNDLKVLNTK